MNIKSGSKVLIVDDEELICDLLKQSLARWGIQGEAFCDIPSATARIKETSFDVALLDVRIDGGSGLNLMPEITGRCPDVKIIIMTGYADKETAIRALRLGAFDFLEKPLEPEILSNTIGRALHVLENERSVSRLIENLKNREQQLKDNKGRLEYLNSELLETNKALSVLVRNIERERDEMERRIAVKLKSLVIPAIEKLMRDKTLVRYEMELGILVKQIEDLTTGFGTDAVVASSLSMTEMKIASLIKNGLTSEDIAKQLHISPSTVRTHRKNIRRKLKINNAQYNLRNYLHSRENSGSEIRLKGDEEEY